MAQALWITLIGMGLVFLAILLLWGLMALLVRITAEAAPDAPADVPDAPAAAPDALADAPVEQAAGTRGALRKRAAAAAVAAALALRAQRSPLPAPNRMSGWQTAHRAAQLQPPARTTHKEGSR